MPELPEVETVRRGLQPVMEGAIIDKVEVHRPDLRRPFPTRLRPPPDRTAGSSRVGRRAKYLVADLDDGNVLVMHLGMSGSFRIEGDGEARIAGRTLSPALEARGARPRRLPHVVRRLASSSTIPAASASWTSSRGRRSRPRSICAASARAARQRLGRRRARRSLRRPQDTVEGRAHGSAPRRRPRQYLCLRGALAGAPVAAARRRRASPPGPASPVAAAGRLATAIREVLEAAIAAGGSSLRDHRRATGELGDFQHEFAVYDRDGEPCLRKGCRGTIRRIVQSGRSTFYCPVCQR